MNGNQTSGIADRDIAQDALTMHKHLADLANMGCIESASQAGLQTFQQIHRTELDHARRVYQLMNQRGWYNPQPAQPQAGAQTGFGRGQQATQQALQQTQHSQF